MLFFAKDLFQLATTVLTEISVSGGDGLIGGAIKQVQEYFRSTDSLKKYYDLSVDRSILSLEIALKGPRAYYPTREKEFYQKHFSHFEKQIFSPFSKEAMRKGIIRSEEELRIQCIDECEKIKKKAPAILKVHSIPKEEIQNMLQDTERFSPQISEEMLKEMKKTIQCNYMIPLLEKENVLLAGIVFHFHNFIQADPNFSNYLNYMELSQIRKKLGNMNQNATRNPKLQGRVKRLENFLSHFTAYEEKMGAIGKKLDDIYEKTIQTYEILERLEVQMQSNFCMMEERLKTIYDLILSGKVEKEEKIPCKAKQEVLVLPDKQEKEDEKEKSVSTPEPLAADLSKQASALPHKHKFHVLPNASLFGNTSPLKQEAQPCVTTNTIHDSLRLYSLFLQESEKENPSILCQNPQEQQKKMITFPWLNPEKHILPEEKPKDVPAKTKKVKADQIPSIFT